MDLKQFEKNVLPLKNKVFRLAFHLLRHQSDAEDATQEIYLKLWTLRSELSNVENIEAYVLRVTRNLCLDKLRIKSRIETMMQLNEEWTDETLGADKILENKDFVSLVRMVIDSLPETQRTVIYLRDVEGLEMNEIAQITGLNENAIKVNLSRARQKVRDAFGKRN
jgi:RNA polymerase sigma-70 factor, ECF subfamily